MADQRRLMALAAAAALTIGVDSAPAVAVPSSGTATVNWTPYHQDPEGHGLIAPALDQVFVFARG